MSTESDTTSTYQVPKGSCLTERQRMMVRGVQSPKQNARYLGSMKPFLVSVSPGSLGVSNNHL